MFGTIGLMKMGVYLEADNVLTYTAGPVWGSTLKGEIGAAGTQSLEHAYNNGDQQIKRNVVLGGEYSFDAAGGSADLPRTTALGAFVEETLITPGSGLVQKNLYQSGVNDLRIGLNFRELTRGIPQMCAVLNKKRQPSFIYTQAGKTSIGVPYVNPVHVVPGYTDWFFRPESYALQEVQSERDGSVTVTDVTQDGVLVDLQASATRIRYGVDKKKQTIGYTNISPTAVNTNGTFVHDWAQTVDTSGKHIVYSQLGQLENEGSGMTIALKQSPQNLMTTRFGMQDRYRGIEFSSSLTQSAREVDCGSGFVVTEKGPFALHRLVTCRLFGQDMGFIVRLDDRAMYLPSVIQVADVAASLKDSYSKDDVAAINGVLRRELKPNDRGDVHTLVQIVETVGNLNDDRNGTEAGVYRELGLHMTPINNQQESVYHRVDRRFLDGPDRSLNFGAARGMGILDTTASWDRASLYVSPEYWKVEVRVGKTGLGVVHEFKPRLLDFGSSIGFPHIERRLDVTDGAVSIDSASYDVDKTNVMHLSGGVR